MRQDAAGPAARRPSGRRDFCDNPVVDRGIALRRNLGLPTPEAASTLIHGLAPATSYHFTVACVAVVDGDLRESPPSLASRPLEVPAVDDEDWNAGELLEKVLAYGSAASRPRAATAPPAGGGDDGASAERASEDAAPPAPTTPEREGAELARLDSEASGDCVVS